jgi:O-6-methylguanine DNA methyltransferase
MNPDDPLAAELATLIASSPAHLLSRIAATWSRTPGPVCDLYVASTHRGVVYVRTSEAVHDDAAEFADAFHCRFGRPLMPATAPPERDRFDLTDLSPVEREILLAVLTIPRGQVRPSTWLAQQVGQPRTTVDIVLCANPIPILIPCHRVIGPDGTLGGYVFGPETKQALLSAEGTNLGEVYELAQHDTHHVTGGVRGPACPNAAGQRHGVRSVAETDGDRPGPDRRPAPGEVG